MCGQMCLFGEVLRMDMLLAFKHFGQHEVRFHNTHGL